eukprot:snap_masked-scaffold_10-processed-gene-9.16-mRNA-1 protein AED:1.00 eAED:1.00 QI:0/0/0/0/1/1/2/0/261
MQKIERAREEIISIILEIDSASVKNKREYYNIKSKCESVLRKIKQTEHLIFTQEANATEPNTFNFDDTKLSLQESKNKVTSRLHQLNKVDVSKVINSSDNASFNIESDGSKQKQLRQQLLEREQEETLGEISHSVNRLGEMAKAVNVEIDEQNFLLDELDEDVNNLQARLDFTLEQMDLLLGTNNRCETLIILLLIFIKFLSPYGQKGIFSNLLSTSKRNIYLAFTDTCFYFLYRELPFSGLFKPSDILNRTSQHKRGSLV